MKSKAHDQLQIVGLVGVIVGLLLVTFEVRQANQIAISTTEISIRQNYIAFHASILENESVAMLLVKSQDPQAEFSDLEVARIYAFIGQHINNWAAIETAYRHGMVPQSSMDIVFEDINGMLSYYKALGQYFREYAADYSSLESFEFVKTLYEVTSETES
jgi:hypothetical protein